MSNRKIELDDFVDLGVSIKGSLRTHSIDSELHYSIISDVLFHCANMIDEKTGSYHHEMIDGLIDNNLDKFIDDYKEDKLVTWFRVTLGVGKKHANRLYQSEVESNEGIRESLALAMGITQTGRSFEEISERRKGVRSVGFCGKEYPKDEDWEEFTFTQDDTGEYDYSFEGICDLIATKVEQKG